MTGAFRDKMSLKTPVHQLIERLQELHSANAQYPEYQEGISEALSAAVSMLATERSHIKQAWREGAEGILVQTAEQYFRETYNQKWESHGNF